MHARPKGACSRRLHAYNIFPCAAAQGKVDSSVLAKAQALTRAHTPEDAVRRRASVFQFEKGVTPVPSRARASPTRYALGMQVSLGRTRWSSEGVNVFSVAEGKRLASTPAPHMTHYESIRHEKMQRAALESPQIRGYRLLPAMTPGRAMLWGTVLAVWGTAALVASTARSLGIQGAEDAGPKLRAALQPLGEAVEARLAPLKPHLSTSSADGIGASVRGTQASAASVAAKFRSVLV